MLDILKVTSNRYERNARLYPGLILLFPILMTGAAIVPGLETMLKSFLSVVATLGGSYVLAYVLAQLARDAGKRGELQLFRQWGAMPSVSIFRHQDTRISAIVKSRYHKKLSKLVKTKAPTVKQEHENPTSADDIYAAWSTYIRLHTRDTKKYPLLFSENVSYGFRRNTWGLRIFGVAENLACLCALGLKMWFGYSKVGTLEAKDIVLTSLIFTMLLLWSFWFTRGWVRLTADAYAERLAEAVETL